MKKHQFAGGVEEWLAERTYHHLDYSDIENQVAMKEEQGVSVSVCLPTLNESATVGVILRVLREELMDRYPLIDQLAIVDSRSTDGTVEVAEQEGAQVIFDDEILPAFEPATGKGEALWKSLYALTGDIIVWIDSDIKNFHPRFVYGLTGPLLSDEEIQYVKGFYERPIKDGGIMRSTGGGRVTELTVRPMLNLFYPELTGLIQPLSGEYSGRRAVLESIPFFTGYGVETGLVLDIYREFGIWAFAQVDLDVREHHNQSLYELSKMSFAVLQALFARLTSDGKLDLEVEPAQVYNSVRREGGERVVDALTIKVIERPPMKTIPEYRQMRARSKE